MGQVLQVRAQRPQHAVPRRRARNARQYRGCRLKKHSDKFPIERKVLDLCVEATGQVDPGAKDYVPAVDA